MLTLTERESKHAVKPKANTYVTFTFTLDINASYFVSQSHPFTKPKTNPNTNHYPNPNRFSILKWNHNTNTDPDPTGTAPRH